MLSVHYRTTLPAIPPERSHAKHTLFLLAQISCISFAIGANPFVLFDYWRKWLMSLFAIGLCHGKHTLFLLAQIACISIAIGAMPCQAYSLHIFQNHMILFHYWCCHGKNTPFLLAQIIWISLDIVVLCHGKHTLFLLAQISCFSFAIGTAKANILSSYWPK